jgi:hypothetical protein
MGLLYGGENLPLDLTVAGLTGGTFHFILGKPG